MSAFTVAMLAEAGNMCSCTCSAPTVWQQLSLRLWGSVLQAGLACMHTHRACRSLSVWRAAGLSSSSNTLIGHATTLIVALAAEGWSAQHSVAGMVKGHGSCCSQGLSGMLRAQQANKIKGCTVLPLWRCTILPAAVRPES